MKKRSKSQRAVLSELLLDGTSVVVNCSPESVDRESNEYGFPMDAVVSNRQHKVNKRPRRTCGYVKKKKEV